jgi:hypothetical protein
VPNPQRHSCFPLACRQRSPPTLWTSCHLLSRCLPRADAGAGSASCDEHGQGRGWCRWRTHRRCHPIRGKRAHEGVAVTAVLKEGEDVAMIIIIQLVVRVGKIKCTKEGCTLSQPSPACSRCSHSSIAITVAVTACRRRISSTQRCRCCVTATTYSFYSCVVSVLAHLWLSATVIKCQYG